MDQENISALLNQLAQLGGPAELEAIELLLAERVRQFNQEGWTIESDDTERREGQLAAAGACYLLEDKNQNLNFVKTGQLAVKPSNVHHSWPFHRLSWKPASPRRMTVKGAALALAELTRLIRANIP